MKKRIEVLVGILPPLAFLGLFLLVWEISYHIFKIPNYLLPSPSSVFIILIEKWSVFTYNSAITLYEAVMGFILASFIGIMIAIIISSSKLLERVIYPYAVIAKVIPIVAVAPLIMIWLGFGVMPKVFISALVSFFPIVVNTVKGLKSTDPQMLRLMHTISATPSQIFYKLKLPASLPFLFSGLKISITLSLVGAIVGELVGADRGLGHLIMLAQAYFDTRMLFGSIYMSAILGLILFGSVSLLEMVFIRWQPPID